jgi:DNA helicase-2/ATP-dependent DNA helicase PcrA
VRVFEQSWSSEGFYSRDHEERRLAQGRDTLRRFIERETAAREKTVQVEQTFKFRQGMNAITGRWDRIDERDDGITIVDFKTSDVEEEDGADERTAKSLKGSQLGIYALAYRETRQVVPARVELHFVGSGTVGAARVTAEHLDLAAERIGRAAAGIRAADFQPRPEYTACRNCPYNILCPHSATRTNR